MAEEFGQEIPDELRRIWTLAIAERMAKKYPCGGCGDCCNQDEIAVLDEEIKRMALFFGVSRYEFVKRYLRPVGKMFTFKETHPCPFYGIERRVCAIYNVRPSVCRNFPYQSSWFLDIVFDQLKPGSEIRNWTLLMAEGCPCRQDIEKRVRVTIEECLGDKEYMLTFAKKKLARTAKK